MTVNNRLHQYLKESGITQTELSQKIGISRQNVNTWFTKGANISDKMLIRIVQVIEQVDARWLITGQPQSGAAPVKGKTFTTIENYEVMLSKLMDSQRALGSVEAENKYLRQQVGELQRQIMELQRLRPGT